MTSTAALSPEARWLAACLSRGDLAPLGAEEVAELATEFERTSVVAGTLLFRQGDRPDRVYVLRSGSVELVRSVGVRRLALVVLRPGDVFGDVPVLLERPEPFDAEALEDSVVFTIDPERLSGLLRRRPRLAQRWHVSLADRMARTQERLFEVLAGGLDAQVAALLLHQPGRGDVGLTQKVVAELVGVQRSSVNRALKRLEAAGLIERGYRRITVVDAAGLAELAGEPLPADRAGPRPGCERPDSTPT